MKLKCPRCGKSLGYVSYKKENGKRIARCNTDGYLTAEETELAFKNLNQENKVK